MRRKARITSGGGGGGSAPVSSFTWSPLAQLPPVTVNFTDTSTNSPTAWNWQFFNSSGAPIGSSSVQNPSFNFTTEACTARLVASNASGTGDTFARTVVGSSDLINSLPAGAQVGTEVSVTTPWDPVGFRDFMYLSNGFGTPGSQGNTPTAVDSNGFPLSGGWSTKIYEAAGRGSAPTVKLGVWKLRATPRTQGVPGTWNEIFGPGSGSTLTNVQYDSGANLVTADLTISSVSATIGIECTAPVTSLRILEPNADPSDFSALNAESLAYLKRLTTCRLFNAMGLNNGYGTKLTWAQWPSPNRYIGQKGWGFVIKIFSEIYNAPQSRCKFLSLNLPAFFDLAQSGTDIVNWLTYIRDNLPAGAGLLLAGVNETWNSIYPTLHAMVAQVNGQTISATGDTIPQISRADLVRVAGVGRGTGWRMVTSGSHAAEVTVITLAAGQGEGSIVSGDSLRFAGSGVNYTTSSNIADVSAGGTITISPALTASVAAGTMLELNTYSRFPKLWALREARLWKTAKDLFGSAWGTRVYGMCHTHFVNESWHQGEYLPFLNEAAQVAEFGAINTYIHGIGGAPYPTLSLTTYQACTSAAEIVDKLRNSTFNEDVTLNGLGASAGLPQKFAVWNSIRNTYGIRINYCYEIGYEHQGYIPWPGGPAQFYINDFIIDAIRSAGFKTFCDDMWAVVRAANVRILEALNACPTSYVPPRPPAAPALPNPFCANSHWGFVDAQLATSYAQVWDWTGNKATALRDHAIVTGQWPL